MKIKISEIFVDLLLIVGFGSFLWGWWLVYEPLAFIFGGIIFVYLAFPIKKRQ